MATERTLLNSLLATFDRASHVSRDPVRFPRRFETQADREIVALLATSLAFGNVTGIGRSIERVLAVLGDHPAERVSKPGARRSLIAGLDGFAHRVYRGEDVAMLLANAGELLRAHGSLESAFVSHAPEQEQERLLTCLTHFADDLRIGRALAQTPSRGMAHLIPDVRRGSAAKRLLLFLRWMVRPDDGTDLGVWKAVSPSELVIPVDVHIHRMATNLGLTTRRAADMRTAQEITARLRALDASDPVKYDFALCHMGISRACLSKRDASCRSCVLRPACVHHVSKPRSRSSSFRRSSSV